MVIHLYFIIYLLPCGWRNASTSLTAWRILHFKPQPTLHIFYSNLQWPNNRTPFKIWIEATSVTFTENGAHCYTNGWKATICLSLFLCGLPLFHSGRVMRGATRPPLLGFCVSSPSSCEFLRPTSHPWYFSLVKINMLLSIKTLKLPNLNIAAFLLGSYFKHGTTQVQKREGGGDYTYEIN